MRPTAFDEGAACPLGRSSARAAVGVAEAIGEGPKAMKPSIVMIFTALERTKGCAHAWAQSQPEHGEELGKFIKDLNDRIKGSGLALTH